MDEPTVRSEALDFHAELNALVDASGQWGAAYAAGAAEAFAPGIGAWWLAAIAMAVVGVVGERFACWKLDGLNRRIVNAKASCWAAAAGYAAFRIVFDVIGARS